MHNVVVLDNPIEFVAGKFVVLLSDNMRGMPK